LRTAVIDSTPLINLVHLELVTELSLFFDIVYVPRQVQTEVNRKHRFRYLLRELLDSVVHPFGWLCDSETPSERLDG
jgi:hypothetical protein